VLLRVLDHLLENAVREANPGGNINLQITSTSSPYSATNSVGSVLVEVIDDGKGLPPGTCLDATVSGGIGEVNGGSHRYAIGSRGSQHDPDELQQARTEMEEGLRNLKQNGVGIGLPLSYHLVRMLGGDLRHDVEFSGGTRIWFSLPNKVDNSDKDDPYDVLQTEQIFKKSLPPTQISFVQSVEANKKRKRDDDADFGNFVSSDSSAANSSDGDDSTDAPATHQKAMKVDDSTPPAAVAKCGVKASMPFSVLVVEDTDICARLLSMQLKKMNCSTQRAENGQVALDILKNSMTGQFDLILMDLRMPVMDGLEATKLIREELKLTDIPILALTGEKRDDIESECEGIGFTDFFSKPLPKTKLEETIKKYKALRDGVETN
jgi:CheY-like chemotaxis protein